jgi:hypothetical protein
VKREGPRAVGDLLVSAVPELRERLVEDRIRRTWSAVVGADVARRARPQTITHGCLHIVVDNSAWLQELTLRTGELTARIAERFAAIRTLRFTLGRLEGPAPTPLAAAPRHARTLGPDDVRDIDAAVAPIADREAREAARRLLGAARRYGTPRETS